MMEIRSSKKSSVRHFIWIFFVALFALFDTVAGQKNVVTKFSGTINDGIRPDVTLLQFFSKSFDPEAAIVSPDCYRDSALYRDGLANYEPWALQMYDASTKIPAGLITGNTKQFGNYDECLRVQSDHGFVGKACSAQVRFVVSGNSDGPIDDGHDLDMADLLINVALASGLANWTSGVSAPYEWLWCVPSSCSPRDIAETIEVGLDSLKHPTRLEFIVKVGNESCHTKESDRPVLDMADWLYISLLVLFGCLVVISTSYDLVKLRNQEKPDPKDTKHKIFVSFSAYTNGKNLLNSKRGSGSIACLDGLRFLSICWIIYGHTHYLRIVGAELDLLGVATMHESWDTLLLLNGNIVTDTFFLLSGILLAHTEMKRKENSFDRHRLNIWNLYVRRYLRLTPAYAIIIGFYATLFYKIGSGPNWVTWVGANRNFCLENWWTNLLYVNNYINVGNMCMSQTWYLSVDMQLVWISPIFLYPMLSNGKRKQLIFLTILTTALLASVLAPFMITYSNELTGTMLYYKNQKDVGNVYLQIYTRVYTRAAPYLLGLGLGYMLRKIKPSNTSIPITFTLVGWTLSIAAGFAVIFGPRGMYFPDHNYDSIEAAFYAGFHRPVFAFAVGWIVIASVFDVAGPVGAILTWNIWVPLSKLTYSAYLTHYIILLYNAGNIRTPGNLTTFGVVQSFFGNLAITLIVSVILSLTFEIPFVHLSNLLTSRNRPIAFVPTNFKRDNFETSQSTLEINRSFDDVSSNVSRTYQDLMDRYAKVSIGSLQQPEFPNNEINSSESSSSYTIDFDGTYNQQTVGIEPKMREAPNSRDSRTKNGLENSRFEKMS